MALKLVHLLCMKSAASCSLYAHTCNHIHPYDQGTASITTDYIPDFLFNSLLMHCRHIAWRLHVSACCSCSNRVHEHAARQGQE